MQAQKRDPYELNNSPTPYALHSSRDDEPYLHR